jgi:Carboxymuconolactone decarboxylase family
VSSALLAKAARRSLGQIRYVSPVRPRAADGLVALVYAQAERDFGMLAPPVALHSPAPGPLAAAWVMLRETLLVTGRATRAEKEVVAAATSAGNSCPYCVTVHQAAARGVIRGPLPAEDGTGDGRLAEIARYARRHGDIPVPDEYFPELAAVALTFHYLNRMVNVFLPESLLPPQAPKAVRSGFMRVLGSVMLSSDPVPGAALGLLPEAPLPSDLSWAAAEPRLAAALGQAAAAIEEASRRAVPPPARELVLGRLAAWDGTPPGPSRAWADAAVAGLPVAARPAARLALLTAQASYQVSPSDVDALGPAPETLIELTSWASLAAARHLLARPAPPAARPAPPAAHTSR